MPGTVTADFNRWAKDGKGSFIATFCAFPFANMAAMLVGGVMTAAIAPARPAALRTWTTCSATCSRRSRAGWRHLPSSSCSATSARSCAHCLYNAAVGWSRIVKQDDAAVRGDPGGGRHRHRRRQRPGRCSSPGCRCCWPSWVPPIRRRDDRRPLLRATDGADRHRLAAQGLHRLAASARRWPSASRTSRRSCRPRWRPSSPVAPATSCSARPSARSPRRWPAGARLIPFPRRARPMDHEVFDLGNVVLQRGATLRNAKARLQDPRQAERRQEQCHRLPDLVLRPAPGQRVADRQRAWRWTPRSTSSSCPTMLGNGLSSSPSNTPAPYDRARFPQRHAVRQRDAAAPAG